MLRNCPVRKPTERVLDDYISNFGGNQVIRMIYFFLSVQGDTGCYVALELGSEKTDAALRDHWQHHGVLVQTSYNRTQREL